MEKHLNTSVYEIAASNFIKSFGDPAHLIRFMTEASYLAVRYAFDKKETKMTGLDFDNCNWNILQFINEVALEWITNLHDPIPAVAKALMEVVQFNGIDGLSQLAKLMSCSYEYHKEAGNYSVYKEIQAINQLAYILLRHSDRSLDQPLVTIHKN